MELCIHKGAKENCGACLEIEHEGNRVLFDLGLPLDADFEDTPLPSVNGLDKDSPDLLGLVISHAHLDHYGLAATHTEVGFQLNRWN